MLPYTAIFQQESGDIRIHNAHASNDRIDAWEQISDLNSKEDEQLIAIVPGSHPIISARDIAEHKSVDVFDLNY